MKHLPFAESHPTHAVDIPLGSLRNPRRDGQPPPRPDDPSVLETDNTPDDAVNRIDYQIDTSPDNRLNPTHPLTIRITPDHDDPYH